MDLFDSATAAEPAPAAATAAEPASDNVSLDQLISEAVATAPPEQDASRSDETDPKQPSAAETHAQSGQNAETDKAAAASVEGTSKPVAEQAAAEPAKEPDDAVSVQRARKILAEANRKEQQARQQLANAEKDFIDRLLANPRNFLGKHNKSIAELIDIDLGQDHDPKEQQPQSIKPEDVAKLVQDAVKQALSEREQISKLDSIKADIRSNIGKDQRFELINRSRSTETVLEFMQEYYDTHGKAIPWDKAAQLVETDLRERFGYTPAPAKPATAPANKVPQRETTANSKPATGNTTLTNNEIRSAGPPSDDEPTDPDQLIKWLVAREERRQQAQSQ